uniref:RecF/RecN/SMC N-terminal domain-containing protein n=1 Tax=Arcella intermedia TaxID=1963864 RepID=A0A6B2L7D9_9EUKA
MRIKKIILSGFKSYLSQENFDDFHPLTNVIVGRNGSGKSNLIVAIRFVLSAEFQKLRTEERKQLLHFGQDNIVSGYVEIHFDNEDKRFPIDSSEVRLRRTIGVTKTEYYLNGRHIPAEDVMNLLESAGFSRSNPYYIVQQGKVQALSKMKPSERLDLLHEVAGTRVYDERRAESIKIMEESKSKKVKINEVLSFLDERLGELEREKDELKGYQALDKLRRVLEFTILNKELKEVTKRIEGLDETRTNNAKRIEKLHEESKEIYTQILNKEKEVKDITALLNQKMPIKENLEIELLGKEKSRARLELVLRSHKANSSDAANKREGYSKQFEKVEKEIEAVRKNLESITPQFHQAQEVEQKVVKEIAEKNRRGEGD